MLNFSIGLALLFVIVWFGGKSFEVKGLLGFTLVGFICYGLGAIVTGCLGMH